MQKTLSIWLTGITVATQVGPATNAQETEPICGPATTITFVPDGVTAVWQDTANWFPARFPDENDIVCIPGATVWTTVVEIAESICTGGSRSGLSCTDCPLSTCNTVTEKCDGGPLVGTLCHCPGAGASCDPAPGGDIHVNGLVVESKAELRVFPFTRVFLDGNSSFRGRFVVESDGVDEPPTGDGHITVKNGNSVWLSADSVINGVVNFDEPSTLYIDGDVTIEGNGGRLRGDCDPNQCQNPSRIRQADGGATAKLTLTTAEGGDSNDRNKTVFLHENWVVEIEFQNDTFVVADIGQLFAGGFGEIRFEGPSLSGSGFWIAEKRSGQVDFGLIDVDTEIVLPVSQWTVGVGQKWVSKDGVPIVLGPNASLTGLTGNVSILGGAKVSIESPSFSAPADLIVTGTLELDTDFSMSGNLSQTGSITVTSGHKAEFHVSP